jgi:hypothetical protein
MQAEMVRNLAGLIPILPAKVKLAIPSRWKTNTMKSVAYCCGMVIPQIAGVLASVSPAPERPRSTSFSLGEGATEDGAARRQDVRNFNLWAKREVTSLQAQESGSRQQQIKKANDQ